MGWSILHSVTIRRVIFDELLKIVPESIFPKLCRTLKISQNWADSFVIALFFGFGRLLKYFLKYFPIFIVFRTTRSFLWTPRSFSGTPQSFTDISIVFMEPSIVFTDLSIVFRDTLSALISSALIFVRPLFRRPLFSSLFSRFTTDN